MMKFNIRKTVAVIAAVATLAVVPPIAAQAYSTYGAADYASSADAEKQNVVSFYDADQNLIQTVGYYAKDKVAFSQYALGIQAPAVEGKTFAGWAFASNDGDVPVNVNDVVTGDWAVYATYKDAGETPSAKQVTVTFADGRGNTIKTVTKDENTAFSAFADGVNAPASEGNKFAGWTVNGYEAVSGDYKVTTNIEVVPLYVLDQTPSVEQVKVTFWDGKDFTNPYKVVYKAKGSTFSAFAADVTAPKVDGKTFAGWADVPPEGGYTKVDVNATVNGNGWNVYPTYKDADPTPSAKQVTVTFTDGRGNTIKTVTKDENTAFSAFAAGVNAPASEGNKFAGWTVDGINTLTDGYKVAKNIEVSPLYVLDQTPTAKQVTVTFTDGRGNTIKTVTKDENTAFADFTEGVKAPASEGNVFKGWTIDGTTVLANDYKVAKNIEVVPFYVLDQTPTAKQVTVTFTDGRGNTIKAVSKDEGTAFSAFAKGINAPASEGNKFAGWTINGYETVADSYKVTKDIEVVPLYIQDQTPTAKQVTVTFTDGRGNTIKQVSKDENAAFADFTEGVKAPASEGNVFKGWTIDGWTVLDGSYKVAKNIEVVPFYVQDQTPSAKQVTVTFTDGRGNTIKTVTKDEKTAFSVFADGVNAPASEGNKFAGWTVNGYEAVSGDYKVAKDLEVVPLYIQDQTPSAEQRTVTFVDPSGNVITTVSKDAGTTIEQFAADVKTPAVPGKVFDHWAFDDGQGNLFDADPSMPVDYDVTLTAVYKDAAPAPATSWIAVFRSWWSGLLHW